MRNATIYDHVSDVRDMLERLARCLCRHPAELQVTATAGHRVVFTLTPGDGDYGLLLGKVETVPCVSSKVRKVPKNLNAIQVVMSRMTEKLGVESSVNLEEPNVNTPEQRQPLVMNGEWKEELTKLAGDVVAWLVPGKVSAEWSQTDTRTIKVGVRAHCGDDLELEQAIGTVLDQAAGLRGQGAVFQLTGTKLC